MKFRELTAWLLLVLLIGAIGGAIIIQKSILPRIQAIESSHRGIVQALTEQGIKIQISPDPKKKVGP
jgi:hypothetical protein